MQVTNLRPLESSEHPDRDMRVVRQWLHAVAAAEVVAPRFTLAPGEAVLVRSLRGLVRMAVIYVEAVACFYARLQNKSGMCRSTTTDVRTGGMATMTSIGPCGSSGYGRSTALASHPHFLAKADRGCP